MQITLHPKIAELLMEDVNRQNNLPKTKRQMELNQQPITADEFVNEILWMSLRKGDISKHYTSK